ncbi:Radical SAM superfamily enzyme, MoaA/NifB/PqqE/SkfB family [Saccharopolyspora kobensis]|uniref:Radical SAM superfamily enzyme, MoaA/NifB/PqqE/SkfB family n=1 Tax=Saccharopolyspora kobensis TaxID=146035 RepID=A0A1H6E5X7_9PSEU|nr:radical SAM protein [Saccharopolyspora kobensis]SEG92366.1 Radical SAM superfamily enzyme, MoaA/NifB/PqqE/SkfB family [Saccharopolyspora kobensis]SFD37044.1 Radical SAM superfamily enzyme, MoaA/NifB/PqqE/SkfB family [Saccharopolyspora kobensis]
MAGLDQTTEAIWDRFPAHERLAINYTLTCNLSCAHCIVESSPQRRERLTSDEVHSALRSGLRSGKKHVTFSGGEVFLFPEEMCEIIAFARELGYVVDVESNAFWARDDRLAKIKLAPFVEAGISGIAFSADAYHVQSFPVQRTINAARAARSFGLLTEINFCPSQDRRTDEEIIAALTEAGEPFLRNELLDRGRGADLIPLGIRRPVEDLQDCDSLTTTVHATGDVFACCELDVSTDAMKRTPVFLGSIRTNGDSADQQAERERLVTGFYDPESPIYFRKMVREHPAFQEFAEDRYRNICEFCMRVLGAPKRVAALSAVLAEHSAHAVGAERAAD